jgi:copper chaperone CopZ
LKETFHLQNVRLEGCAQNVKMAPMMIDGVRAVHVHREELLADVLYDPPATPLQLREQLLLAGYLAEDSDAGGDA